MSVLVRNISLTALCLPDFYKHVLVCVHVLLLLFYYLLIILFPIEMIEYAICSQEMDSQLFEIVKFLLQVINALL